MANYYASTRTNYFRVKDEEEFRKFMAHVSGTEDRVELWEEKDNNGNTVFGFGTLGGIAGVTDYHNDSDADSDDEDCEDDFDAFLDGLQTFVADDDAIIILESGHEKLRYVVGSAYIITRDHCDYLDIRMCFAATDVAKAAVCFTCMPQPRTSAWQQPMRSCAAFFSPERTSEEESLMTPHEVQEL